MRILLKVLINVEYPLCDYYSQALWHIRFTSMGQKDLFDIVFIIDRNT